MVNNRLILASTLTLGTATSMVSATALPTLTALAESAVYGLNVSQPVPGFEIKLLQDGQTIFHEAFGDWTIGRVASADSSTKTISGAVIMSVVDSSFLPFTLDSRLTDFMPEYGSEGKQDITIRQAFSHTSGFSGQESSSLSLTNPFITLRQAAFQIGQLPLANGPAGSTFAYGGLSMHAAGAAAQIATGTSFVDLFDERLAVPLEMNDTRFYIASDANPRVSGGIESTADDFSRFMDMLLNDGVDRVSGTRVLESSSVDAMLSRQTTDEQVIANSPVDNNRYGIGVWVDQLTQASSGVDALAGGARGFHSWIDESEGLVFTFSTDLSQFGNVETLSSLMHAAILADLSGELVGDLDGDTLVNQIDIDLLAAAIRSGSTGVAFDINQSGGVDDFDLAFLITGLLGTAPGDANLDRRVDLIDLSALAANFNRPGQGWGDGDFDGNGFVNLVDLSILAGNFGFGGAVSTIPEPGTITGLLVLSLLKRRGSSLG
ncbi:MAG: serine hydrolase [Phycisphaeraceae bacterium]